MNQTVKADDINRTPDRQESTDLYANSKQTTTTEIVRVNTGEVDGYKKISDEDKEFIHDGNPNELLVREGTIPSSIFSLVILCLGSGTLTFPYIFYANGMVLGTLLIVFGAAVSIYTGWLIVKCAEQCEAKRYEDIALKLYGRKMATFTSVMILLTMLGFVIAYIVLVSAFLRNKPLFL